MSSSTETGAKARSSLLRKLRLVATFSLGLLAILTALVWWRLALGPVPLDRFIDPLQDRVGQEIAPLTMKIGGASLVWHGWRSPLEVRVRDVGLIQQDGDPLVRVSSAALAMDKGPLLGGAVAPVWLEVNDIEATVVRDEDGRIDIGLPRREPGAGSPPLRLGPLAQRWLAPPDPDTPLGRLTTIRVRNASLRLDDRALGLVATAHEVDVELNRGEALLDVTVPLRIEIEETTTRAQAGVTYRLDEGSLQARLEAPGVKPSRFANLHPALARLATLDVAADLAATVEVSDALELEAGGVTLGGDWGRLQGALTLTRGFDAFDVGIQLHDLQVWRFAGVAPELRFVDFRHPVNGEIEMGWAEGELRGGSVRLHGTEGAADWGELSGEMGRDDAEGRATIGRVRLQGIKPWMFARATGVTLLEDIRLPLTAQVDVEIHDGAVHELDLELESGEGHVVLGEIYPEPVDVRRLSLQAAARDGLSEVHVQQLELDLGDVQPGLVAQATKQDGGYSVQATASLERIDIDRLSRYWPPTKAEKTNRWITEHILAGTAQDVVFQVACQVDPDGESRVQGLKMTGSMAFDGLVVDVLAPKPVIEGVGGTATFEDGTLAFDIDRGHLKDFEVDRAHVEITGLESKEAKKHLTVDLQGPLRVASARELLSGKPLNVLNTDRLDTLNGQADARVKLDLTLSGPDRNLQWEAQAQVSDMSWTDGPLDFELSDGDVTLQASPLAVAVQGHARANGIPAQIEYLQGLGGRQFREADVRARVDEEGLLALGLPRQPYLSGTTAMHIQYSRAGDDLATVAVDVDLGDCQVDVGELAWQKPIGQPGRASLVARRQSERAWSVAGFEIQAGDLRAAGDVDFLLGPFQLERLEVPGLVTPDNLIDARVHRTPEGVYELQVSGRRFNLQPPLERMRRGRARQEESSEVGAEPDRAGDSVGEPFVGGGGVPPFAFDVRFDRLYLSPEARLDSFVASGSFDGDHWERAAASATVEPAGGVSLVFGPAEDGYRLEARADSAGEVLAALTGARKATGGQVVVESAGPSLGGPYDGRLETKDVFVTEDIILARILSLASLDGFVDNLTESHLKIRQGKIDFTFDDGVLDLENGRIDYSGFRISAGGTVHFPLRQVSLRMAVAPLGRLQRLLGKLPILGRLFTGWHREGLFATYLLVEGSLTDVDVTRVPLSTLTPGILRDIFGLPPDTKIEYPETVEPE